jgi:hypothetical protein
MDCIGCANCIYCVQWIVFLVIAVIGVVTLHGFFRKMKKGLVPYNSSTMLLTLTVTFAAMLSAIGEFGDDISKLFLAVIGFAGGLFVSENRRESDHGEQKHSVSNGSASDNKGTKE